eukprot:gnl/TRDRNA2_/TRDRNA2_80933_c0_seq2.p1 gnl/TRDRNA2_/TRDRNA2_80933_c0~~gnl/TRDRNA2_/TRDRNA2_80933_c0_seq2.p1  ORF type:complete len:205 (+),score=33.83 gnl/TRDRNA2_/TRDRNA2_80933_c0_seq2:43-657(+)
MPDEIDIESLYQPTCINVTSTRWDKFGYVLIFTSTAIMLFSGVGVGPKWIWKRADDVTTVLFTFELGTRMFEKGYLFYTEEERNWNFFDTLVVAISIMSMLIAWSAGGGAGSQHGDNAGAAMKKFKALRTLRLLRLLRLLRFLKGIGWVNDFVDVFLRSLVTAILSIVIFVSIVGLAATVMISLFMGAKAWLAVHELPKLPKID